MKRFSFSHGTVLTIILVLPAAILFGSDIAAASAGDPTDGFTEVPLKPSNIALQKPYDVPLDQRYSFIDGVHRMWVYSDDKPFSRHSDTQPRTEGLDYHSGVWQMEGHVYVPKGTSGSNFVVQRPYDVPLSQRYSFAGGTHRLWVYADDKPHDRKSHTQPRTEIRITGLNYKSGVWQFEGYGFVPNGTSGATVAQIHGSAHRNTTMILRVYAPGEMRYYSYLHVADGLYDRWFRLNMIHDVDGGKVTVFLDGEQNNTQPRTEIHIAGLDYSSGVWQFEGHGFVPNGTSGATVAQIHGAAHGNTTLLLRVYAPGEMRYYSSLHVADGLYDRWFRLNMIHDVDGGKVTVFLDGEQKFQYHDQGPGDLYFKCGVYGAPANISYYMEARWRNIRIYRKY
ncbi:unnamed protein product [Linum tenue]|uniref:Alginate lyase 2 domain-containing protein n=1 Tax=Linum tenue TaxID=586396 RepID=A0AAV0IIN5_9ROSI|nr:unnamed protein product [Linum tenue]